MSYFVYAKKGKNLLDSFFDEVRTFKFKEGYNTEVVDPQTLKAFETVASYQAWVSAVDVISDVFEKSNFIQSLAFEALKGIPEHCKDAVLAETLDNAIIRNNPSLIKWLCSNGAVDNPSHITYGHHSYYVTPLPFSPSWSFLAGKQGSFLALTALEELGIAARDREAFRANFEANHQAQILQHPEDLSMYYDSLMAHPWLSAIVNPSVKAHKDKIETIENLWKPNHPKEYSVCISALTHYAFNTWNLSAIKKLQTLDISFDPFTKDQALSALTHALCEAQEGRKDSLDFSKAVMALFSKCKGPTSFEVSSCLIAELEYKIKHSEKYQLDSLASAIASHAKLGVTKRKWARLTPSEAHLISSQIFTLLASGSLEQIQAPTSIKDTLQKAMLDFDQMAGPQLGVVSLPRKTI